MPLLFHCRPMGILWSAGGCLILLPTYTRRVLMAFVLRLSAPMRIRYTDLLSLHWRPMDSYTPLGCSTVMLLA